MPGYAGASFSFWPFPFLYLLSDNRFPAQPVPQATVLKKADVNIIRGLFFIQQRRIKK